MTGQEVDTSSVEFQNALSLIRFTRQSVFLTGKAGTGKSTFLRYVCRNVRKKHVVLAPTGIAAINVEGSTLHSFFKLPFHPLVPDDPRFSPRKLRDFLKYKKSHIKLLQQVELVIIDEVSMVRADIIDFIDRVLRVFCHNMREPFGGKQMLFVGDVFQLEPVLKADERDILARYYPNPYFFSARVFRQFSLVSIELTKVFRQKEPAFVNALDHIRENQVSDAELQLLNTRYTPDTIPEAHAPETYNIVLATRRDNVDYINQSRLDRIGTPPAVFEGVVKGEFPETSLPTLLHLELKEGAQVIFVKNDMEKRWVNGTLGRITAIDREGNALEVVTEDGLPVRVEPEKWSNMRYTLNEKEHRIEEEEIGTFTQFPLRLAWAITVHKSQGLTFRSVTVDFSGGTFAGGQAYVALSRCTSLEGLVLRRRLTRSDIFVRPEIIQFAKQFNNQEAIRNALSIAKADEEYRKSSQAFDCGDMQECLDHFFVAIHTRYDIEQPRIRRFIRRKLHTLNTLRRQRDEALGKLHEQDRKLERLAREYVAMGNECIISAHNVKAALANYSKAIDLSPRLTDAWVRRGLTLADDDRLDEALHDLNQAVSLSPRSFKAAYARGRVYMQKQLWSEAVNDLQRATSLNDKAPKAYRLLGDAYSRMGNEDLALLYWELANHYEKNT
ncbi:MAG: tetratricopeptide repeat protein [Bacteroidaceae bacterium]